MVTWIRLYELNVILVMTSKYKPGVCIKYHDLIMKAVNFDKVTIVSISIISIMF